MAEGSIQTPEARKLGLAGGWAHSGGNGRATTSAEGAVSPVLPSSMSMLLSVAFVIPVLLRCNLGLRLRQVMRGYKSKDWDFCSEDEQFLWCEKKHLWEPWHKARRTFKPSRMQSLTFCRVCAILERVALGLQSVNVRSLVLMIGTVKTRVMTTVGAIKSTVSATARVWARVSTCPFTSRSREKPSARLRLALSSEPGGLLR